MSLARMSNVLEHNQTAASASRWASSAGRLSRIETASGRATGDRDALPAGRGPGRARAEGARAKGRQNRPFRWGCPPTLATPALRRRVSTDAVPSRAPRASACEPYRDRIEAALARGRNAMAIWQDLVDEVGFPARYASVRRFVRQLRGTAPPEARVVIVTTPGEEAQVDYGDGPDGPASGDRASTAGRACLS